MKHIEQNIRMTEREQTPTRASEAGAMCYKLGWTIGDLCKYDKALKEAWDQGYCIAKEQHIADCRVGFY